MSAPGFPKLELSSARKIGDVRSKRAGERQALIPTAAPLIHHKWLTIDKLSRNFVGGNIDVVREPIHRKRLTIDPNPAYESFSSLRSFPSVDFALTNTGSQHRALCFADHDRTGYGGIAAS